MSHPFREPLQHERVPSPGIYRSGRPLLVLPEGTKREEVKDTLTQHIEIVSGVRDLVKPCFGPNGMYKLVLSETGANFLTNDSFTILSRIKLDHPLAQVIAGAGVDAARSAGGGSTTTIILASEILNALLSLLKMGYKPSTLLKGCTLAYSRVRKTSSRLSFAPADPMSCVGQIVETSLAGTLLSNSWKTFSRVVREAVETTAALKTRDFMRLDDIYVRSQGGGSVEESRVVRGMALMREPIHPSMPTHFKDARLLVVKGEFQLPKQGGRQPYDHKFSVDSPERYGKLLRSKRQLLTSLLGGTFDCGADIIIVEKGVDEVVLDYAVSRGVAIIRRFPPPEFEHVVRLTGATAISDFRDVSESDLVFVEKADYSKVGDYWWWVLEGFQDPGSCEVLVRGSDQLLFDEVGRLLKSCFLQVRLFLAKPQVTYGGGWFEMKVAKDLRGHARTISSREQTVVEKVAEAFESIPMLLAESSGLDKVDCLTALRSRLRDGAGIYGVDGRGRRISDVRKLGVVEPMHVKMQAIQSAFEAAITVLRVDDVIRSRKLSKEEQYYLERVEKTSPEATRKLQREYGI